MFSILLALILFVVQIPLRAMLTTYKLAKAQVADAVQGDNVEVTEAEKQAKNKERLKKAAKIVTKYTIKGIKALLHLLWVVISLLLSSGVFGLLLMLFIVGGIVVSTIVVPTVLQGGSGNGGTYIGATDVGLQNGASAAGTGAVSGVSDTSGMVEICKKCANWYIDNISSNRGYGAYRVPCDLMPGLSEVRADCTGFAQLYMSMVCGKVVSLQCSATLAASSPEGYAEAGWKYMKVKDIGGVAGLKPGDVLVGSPDLDSRCIYGHAEVYLGPGQAFGYGETQHKFPSSTSTMVDDGSDLIKQGTSNGYIVVYRYMG